MTTATTAQHDYSQRGDLASPCARCRLAFAAAHDHPQLPCSGQYNRNDEQVLLDMTAHGRFDDRIIWYLERTTAHLNAEVATLAAKYLKAKGIGCGKLTYVAGTNGGKMPCGALLRELSGVEHRCYCAACANTADRRH